MLLHYKVLKIYNGRIMKKNQHKKAVYVQNMIFLLNNQGENNIRMGEKRDSQVRRNMG